MATAPRDTRQRNFVPGPNSDLYELKETLDADELALVKQVRQFMENKVAPDHQQVLGRRRLIVGKAITGFSAFV